MHLRARIRPDVAPVAAQLSDLFSHVDEQPALLGLPTLITIVTPDEIRPDLFEPTSPPVVVDPPPRRLGIIRVIFGWR